MMHKQVFNFIGMWVVLAPPAVVLSAPFVAIRAYQNDKLISSCPSGLQALFVAIIITLLALFLSFWFARAHGRSMGLSSALFVGLSALLWWAVVKFNTIGVCVPMQQGSL
jgi:chromate transport protein ChrA